MQPQKQGVPARPDRAQLIRHLSCGWDVTSLGILHVPILLPSIASSDPIARQQVRFDTRWCGVT